MIHVADLRFTYRSAPHETLHGLSFDVRPREIFGFLGPSGAGKSTTQRILTGLITGFRGDVSVFGDPIQRHARGYYERIGVSFEVPNVYGKLTGRENLDFFAGLYRGATEDPARLLALVGLADAADQRVATYSRGMRMRLNFCRALLRNAELLFLDEPTTGQDPENARRIRNVIRARRDAGATVFLTTHDMSVAAELCDRVAFIVDGAITLIDAPRDLMVRYGERRVRVEYVNGDGLAVREFELDTLRDDVAFSDIIRTRRIERIHTLDASLEDVFLRVTGRDLA